MDEQFRNIENFLRFFALLVISGFSFADRFSVRVPPPPAVPIAIPASSLLGHSPFTKESVVLSARRRNWPPGAITEQIRRPPFEANRRDARQRPADIDLQLCIGNVCNFAIDLAVQNPIPVLRWSFMTCVWAINLLLDVPPPPNHQNGVAGLPAAANQANGGVDQPNAAVNQVNGGGNPADGADLNLNAGVLHFNAANPVNDGGGLQGVNGNVAADNQADDAVAAAADNQADDAVAAAADNQADDAVAADNQADDAVVADNQADDAADPVNGAAEVPQNAAANQANDVAHPDNLPVVGAGVPNAGNLPVNGGVGNLPVNAGNLPVNGAAAANQVGEGDAVENANNNSDDDDPD